MSAILSSPISRKGLSSASTYDIKSEDWLSSPFSQLETISPGSALNFTGNSPYIFSPISPSLNNHYKNQSPSDGLSSFQDKARQLLLSPQETSLISPPLKSQRKMGQNLFPTDISSLSHFDLFPGSKSKSDIL